jgi:GAF domain-containing protein
VSPGSTVARVLDAVVPEPALPRFTDVVDPEEDLDPLLAQFESLTRTLLNATTIGAALRQVVDAALVVVPGADLVSVTLRPPKGPFYTPVETGTVAVELDQVQYESGKGPCVDAALPDGPGFVVSDDLRVEGRWPQFAARAVEHGYNSIISTELLSTPDSPSGALNIYSRKTNGFTLTDREAALLLATHAALALAHSHTSELADLRQVNLRQAINSRDVIGQAKGILMNRQGISADEAFDLLRRTSQHLNVKLVDLARNLTSRHTELDEPSPGNGVPGPNE